MKGLEGIAATVFLDIAIIALVARLMGALFHRLRQPAVVGEILAGIVLGPSLLGALPGNLTEHLFPTDVRPFLRILADLGLVIFMFIVGLELDLTLLKGKERLAIAVSASSVALPFTLGFGLAAVLHGSHHRVAGENVDFLPFALFIGASMSVTAFPVLARILTERGLHRTDLGAIALACAAVDDVLAWTLLAVVLAVVSSSSIVHLPLVLFEAAAFVVAMFVLVRPLLERVAKRHREVGRLTPDMLAVILIGVLLASYTTSKIGIHAIFGAFLFGAAMPRDDTRAMFQEILERLEQVSVLLLLPVFFIVTGLGADVGGLRGRGVAQLGLVLLVACTGKFVGAFVASRAMGVRPRKAAALGVLLNTRGLTELVILNVGLSFGVLDPELFTMLVVMAIVTTIMTGPALRVVYPDRLIARDVAEAELAAMGLPSSYRLLVAFPDPETAGPLVSAAVAIVGDERPAELVLTHLAPAPHRVEVGTGLGAELAAMADALAAVDHLASAATDAGIAVVVRSQFSDDAERDLLARAAAPGIDGLVLAADFAAGMPSLLDEPGCTTIVVDGLDRLCATVAENGDGWATLEVAARMSRSLQLPLILAADDRRPAQRWLTGISERLGSAGVHVELRDESPTLRVRSGPGDVGVEAFDRLVHR